MLKRNGSRGQPNPPLRRILPPLNSVCILWGFSPQVLTTILLDLLNNSVLKWGVLKVLTTPTINIFFPLRVLLITRRSKINKTENQVMIYHFQSIDNRTAGIKREIRSKRILGIKTELRDILNAHKHVPSKNKQRS